MFLALITSRRYWAYSFLANFFFFCSLFLYYKWTHISTVFFTIASFLINDQSFMQVWDNSTSWNLHIIRKKQVKRSSHSRMLHFLSKQYRTIYVKKISLLFSSRYYCSWNFFKVLLKSFLWFIQNMNYQMSK